MSSKSDLLENELLQFLFNNTVVASGLLDGLGGGGITGSTVPGDIWVSLHNDDPGEAGAQNTNELSIQNYVRIAVPRTTAGWTVSTNSATNAAQIRFPAAGSFGATGAPEDAVFFGLGVDSGTAAGHLMYYGHLGDDLNVANANGTTDELDVEDNPYVDDDEIFLWEVPGQTLPTGLARGLYFVITPTADTFQIETTLGGGATLWTGDGEVFVARVTRRTLDDGDAFTFEINDLDVFED